MTSLGYLEKVDSVNPRGVVMKRLVIGALVLATIWWIILVRLIEYAQAIGR